MNIKLKLSHDAMAVLTAIADQELISEEVLAEISPPQQWEEPIFILLNEMVKTGLLVSRYKPFAYFYAIAPEILALNNPPYSYESWRALSE